MEELVVQGEISSKIITLRGQNVMLDRDIAALYGVETRRLNEQVKRNIERFPDDFMFQLTENEYKNLMSQIATSSSEHGGVRKMPYVFTEEGIYMLSSVLKSKEAVSVHIAIIRTFKKLREFSKHYNVLAKQIMAVERKSNKQYKELKRALEDLIASSSSEEIRRIGFRHEDD